MNKKQDKLIEKRHIEGNRYMKVEVDYYKGNGRRPRGFYLSVSPVVIGDGFESSVIDFGMASGFCRELLAESPRFNQKLLESLTVEPAKIDAHIAAMLPTVRWADADEDSVDRGERAMEMAGGSIV